MGMSDNEDEGAHEAAGAYVPRAGLGRPAGQARAKLFPNGRSQAVRLPKAFRMPGREVLVHREGRRVILEPLDDPPRDANGWPVGMWERLTDLRRGLADEDFARPPDPPPPAGEFDRLFEGADTGKP